MVWLRSCRLCDMNRGGITSHHGLRHSAFYGPLLCSLKLLESERARSDLFSPARRSWAMLEYKGFGQSDRNPHAFVASNPESTQKPYKEEKHKASRAGPPTPHATSQRAVHHRIIAQCSFPCLAYNVTARPNEVRRFESLNVPLSATSSGRNPPLGDPGWTSRKDGEFGIRASRMPPKGLPLAEFQR